MLPERLLAHVLLLYTTAVIASAESSSNPYILYNDKETRDSSSGFALCLGDEPSKELSDSLLFCRELGYPLCLNSSLIGSVLQVDSETAQHFVKSLDEPTAENIERLAWLIDSALVLLYDAFSTQSNANIECAHEWRNWVCSRAFKRSSSSSSTVALPLCALTCERAENVCEANLHCRRGEEVAPAHEEEQCTDFYRDSGRACNPSGHSQIAGGGGSGRAGSKKGGDFVPVFDFRRHGNSASNVKGCNITVTIALILMYTVVLVDRGI